MHIFLDYPVLDKLYRIDMNEYTESNEKKEGLKRFRSLAKERKLSCYASEITKVEMLHGREQPSASPEQVAYYKEKDKSKMMIAEEMGVIWLTYPASRYDEHLEPKNHHFGYSRIDLTARPMDKNWKKAHELEKKLLCIQGKGVSPGDARQIVSMVYGSPLFHGHHFVTEDKGLVARIKTEVQQGKLNELMKYFFGSVQEFLATLENL